MSEPLNFTSPFERDVVKFGAGLKAPRLNFFPPGHFPAKLRLRSLRVASSANLRPVSDWRSPSHPLGGISLNSIPGPFMKATVGLIPYRLKFGETKKAFMESLRSTRFGGEGDVGMHLGRFKAP